MKFSVQKETLYQTLQKVSKVTPVRSTLPILGCILFTASDNKLKFRATDLEMTMTTACEADVTEEGAIAIPGRMLMEITAELPDGTLQFSLDNDRITISTLQGGEYTVVGRPASEFPSGPIVEDIKEFEYQSADFTRIVEKTMFATSKDENKVALTGVLFQFKKDEFRAVATDGHRLVRYIKNNFINADFMRDIIIPTKFLTLVVVNIRFQETIRFGVAKNHVMVEFDDTRLYSRIIDEKYPDYDSVVPVNNQFTMKAILDDFIAMVKRVSIFSSKNTNQIICNLSADKIEISTEDIETSSSAHELMDINFSGGSLTIAFNAELLKDVLRHIDGSAVVAEMNGSLSATLFFPEEQKVGEDILMLLMPIRTVN